MDFAYINDAIAHDYNRHVLLDRCLVRVNDCDMSERYSYSLVFLIHLHAEQRDEKAKSKWDSIDIPNLLTGNLDHHMMPPV